MEKCNCGREFKNITGLKCHQNKCDGKGTPRDKYRAKGNGNKICPKCNFVIANSFDRHFVSCNGKGPRRKNKTEFIGGFGRSFSEEHRRKLSEASKGNNTFVLMSKEKQEKVRNKARENILKKYANGWQPKCGRCPKYSYNSPIAGKVKVDGSWELAVCKYLDLIKVNWERNTKRFAYKNLKGGDSTYCPDFWVEDWQSYIEVKGYKTDLDDCKWSQFKEKLLIWDKATLEEKEII